MDPLELVILDLVGLFGGVLAGLFGVGGGTVFVPALVFGAGWDIDEAVAASLVIIVLKARFQARCGACGARSPWTGGRRRSSR